MSANVSQLPATRSQALTPSQLASQRDFKDFKDGGNHVRSAIVGAMESVVTGQPPAAPSAPPPAPVAPPAVGVQKPAPIVGSRVATKVDEDLIYILSQPRGHDGKNEKKFCNWIITKLNKMGLKPELMEEGAIFVRVGAETDSATLFSCHVDSVHSGSEEEPQRLAYDPAMQHITLDVVTKPGKDNGKGKDPTWQYSRSGSCLGADDGAGVWVMLKMCEAKVPGGYMFHRGEERGCISSSAMARKQEDWLKQWKAAIAFDRPKDFEVITHQGSAVCASDTYAKALAEALSANPDDTLDYKISANGGTTDTRQYRNIIPECINVGVGYFMHHTADEYVDYGHLKDLMNQCLKVDWKALEAKVTRDPKAAPAYSGGYYGANGYIGGRSSYPNSHAGSSASSPAVGAKSTELPKQADNKFNTTLETLYHAAKDVDDIMDWFEMDPELSAKCFMQALIEGRMAQIQYNMLLSKTLKA